MRLPPFERLEDMPRSYIRVLLHIAKQGPKTKYQIERETKISHATIHEAIRVLLACRQIKGEKIGTTRVGLPKVEYGLTPRGLIESLYVAKREDVEKIVQIWKYVEPLFIAKWDYFVTKVGKRKTENMFRGAAEYFDWDSGSMSSNVDQFIAWAIEYIFEENMEEEELNRWVRAFRGDRQLKQYVIDYVERDLEFAQDLLKRARLLQKKFGIRF